MSQRERDVLKVMAAVLQGKRTQVEAARLLGRSVRQVRRIKRKLKERGDGAVVHGLRGRRSNRAIAQAVREQAASLYRRHYGGFGPTLAAEKLAEDAQGNRVATQFSRALEELGIKLICAHSPQAKGRIERLWGTCQDRLVKELALAKAKDMEQANEVLEAKYLPWFNRRCTVKPSSGNDAHRLVGKGHDLAAILSIQEVRTVANDYTIRLDNQIYQLLPPVWPGQRGGKVVVERRLDGSMKVRFKQRYLEYRAVAQPDRAHDAAAGRASSRNPGALPPDPRSLAHGPIPAEGRQQRTKLTAKGRALLRSGPLRYIGPPAARVALLRCPVCPAAVPVVLQRTPGVQATIMRGASPSSAARAYRRTFLPAGTK